MKSTVITSYEELAEHEDRWEVLRRECRGTVFSSNYLTQAWFKANEASAAPRVILIEDKGELVGVAPLTTYRYKVAGIPVKMLALAGEMKDRLRLSTTQVLYPQGRADVLHEIIDQIKRLDWGMMTTINLESNRATKDFLEAVRGKWFTTEFPQGQKLTLTLPAEGDITQNFNFNARRNLKKNLRRMERAGHTIELKRLAAEDIDRAVDVYTQQHIERWASKGGSYFRNPENPGFLREAVMAAYKRDVGFAYELLIDGQIASQRFGFFDGDRAYGYRFGMNNALMDHSPGWLMNYYFFNELRDKGYTTLVIGAGTESYKYEMGGEVTPLIGVRASRGVVSLMNRVLMSPFMQRLDDRFGLTNKVVKTGSETD
ncbi:MAG: GNAT family N-acetyltransferase [Methanomassiliicoccus sp.]|nr:GNAT family N-acetyltransferase [Methanomassiliicoccus sp.]